MSKRGRFKGGHSPGRFVLNFIIVAVLAVVTGYGLTNYIIKPLFLGEGNDDSKGESILPEQFDGSSIIIDRQEINTDSEETLSAPITGAEVEKPAVSGASGVLYSIQYGSFSDRIGAEAMLTTLASSDIYTIVVEKAGAFKLIGAPFISKDEAAQALAEIKKVLGNEPFITTVEVLMR
ncbi:hypothetical protein MASR2M70_02580 [Bacillota bacterium]